MSNYKGLQTLEVLEGADNYNKWIAASLKPYIVSPALEIGAGIGNISEEFTELEELVLSDNDEYLVKKLQKKFKNNKNITVEILDVASNFTKVQQKFRTVFAINVLEHIEDDIKALRNIHQLLSQDGKVVLLVPAKKFAFSELDRNLGHFRRYEKDELKKSLKTAGFKVSYISYFNIVGLLSWLVRDRVTRDDAHLKISHVKIFDAIVPLLQFIEPKKNLPMGISLIAVASRK